MSKRPTVMDTELFKAALATPNKRFHDGHFYLTQRNTLYAYYPPLRVWIGRDGQCRTYQLASTKKSTQNKSGTKVVPSTATPPGTTPEELVRVRAQIMKEYGLREPAEAGVGTREERLSARRNFLRSLGNDAPDIVKKAPKSPKEVIETIHQAAQRLSAQGDQMGADVLEKSADALEDAAETEDAAAWAAEANVVENYEDTLDYDVGKLITDLWSRCGGSQEDLDWAREEFERIGFIPPPIQAQVTLTWDGNVSVDEMVAELASMGYKVDQQ